MKRRLELQQGLHPLLRAPEVAAAGVHHRATATHTGVDDAPLPRHRQELQHPIAVLLRARAQRRPVHPGRPAGQLLHRAAKGRLPGPAALRRPQQEGKGADARELQRPRRAPAAGAETSATNGPPCTRPAPRFARPQRPPRPGVGLSSARTASRPAPLRAWAFRATAGCVALRRSASFLGCKIHQKLCKVCKSQAESRVFRALPCPTNLQPSFKACKACSGASETSFFSP